MALIPSSRYPAQTDVAAEYPQGKARNASTFQDGTGTPLERDWLNDIWGFLQSLIAIAGISPTGDPDEVGASQYLEAIQYAADIRAERVMLDNWTETATTAKNLNAVVWSAASGLFVAVGEDGHVSDSSLGVEWQSRGGDVAVDLFGVAASASEVVAVGAGGAVTRQATGGSFGSQTSGTANQLRAVAWSGTLFAAVGASGTVITSPTGVTWTTRTSGTAVLLRGITWGGGLFVAVGSGGEIITSPDGASWTVQTSGTGEDLIAVTWFNGTFVAVGVADTILTSPDAITWTDNPLGDSDNHFVAVGATEGFALLMGYIDDAPRVWASPDGATWAVSSFAYSDAPDLRGVAWNSRVAVVAGGSESGSGVVWKSLSRLPI